VFTSSTSFANPAVTLGRMFTDSFTGISPLSGLGFMAAQLVGMLLALALVIPVITASKEKVDD
jgi:glycerol uptake facilitator-like aquaporin